MKIGLMGERVTPSGRVLAVVSPERERTHVPNKRTRQGRRWVEERAVGHEHVNVLGLEARALKRVLDAGLKGVLRLLPGRLHGHLRRVAYGKGVRNG